MSNRKFTDEEKVVLKKIGNNINKVLYRKGKTAKEIAEKTNINQNTISHIKTGRTDPRALTLYKMSQELNVDINEFFKGLE